MTYTFNATSSWSTTLAVTPGEDPSSLEPAWAFYVTNRSGVAATAGVVDSITDQSNFGVASSAVLGLTLDNTDIIGGSPSIRAATDGTGFARFPVYIGQDTRPSLTGGFAICALMKTDETTYDRYTLGQGLFADGFLWSSLLYNQRLSVFEGGGGQRTEFNNDYGGWNFRYITIKPGDAIAVGSSDEGRETQNTRRGYTIENSNTSRFTANCPLLLFNRWVNTNVPDTKGASMSLAALGIVPLNQLGRCRRYWENLYSLAL